MDFDDEKSSYDVIDNVTMSDDEVVASYGPPRSLFPSISHLENISSMYKQKYPHFSVFVSVFLTLFLSFTES